MIARQKATRSTPPKTHRRRGAELYAKDMLEHRPISVPGDSGTGS
jgi:hypothetical protein